MSRFHEPEGPIPRCGCFCCSADWEPDIIRNHHWRANRRHFSHLPKLLALRISPFVCSRILCKKIYLSKFMFQIPIYQLYCIDNSLYNWQIGEIKNSDTIFFCNFFANYLFDWVTFASWQKRWGWINFKPLGRYKLKASLIPNGFTIVCS